MPTTRLTGPTDGEGVPCVEAGGAVSGRRPARRSVLTVLVAALVGVLGVAVAGPAAAHDELVSTDPADGATVPTAPDQVTLTFTDKAIALGTEVKVTAPDGSVVSTGDPQLGPTTVAQPLAPARPAGTYTVVWRVTSADGHPVSGTFRFVATSAVGVAAPTASAVPSEVPSATPGASVASPSAAGPAPTPSASADPVPSASTGRPSYWLVVGAVLVLAAVAAALGRRRRQALGAGTDAGTGAGADSTDAARGTGTPPEQPQP
ncbi:copper resistance protein CopC [Cellulomonas sp. SG140]|uniref:copper resistance CopC family protein n=1 Tax=Cellulomonas sp. SG140 TaxID=2976536 RepID=UPI0021E96B5E|nr:copper resistance protein CopC [Cellulomonas sp. SG140]